MHCALPAARLARPLDLRRIGRHLEGGVGKAFELDLDGGHDLGMAMTGVKDGDPSGKFDEMSAFNVPKLAVFGLCRKQGCGGGDASWDSRKPPRKQ